MNGFPKILKLIGIKQAEEYETLFYVGFLLKKNPLLLFGLGVVFLLLITALFPTTIATFPEDASVGIHFEQKLKGPSFSHLFGTDHLGRDIFSRVVFGSRMSLKIGIIVVAIALLIGVPLGLFAGFWSGKMSEFIMRISDMFLAFPPLLLPMAIVAALGPSLVNAMIAVAVSWFPWYVRLVRAQVLTVKEKQYVEGAQSIGVSNTRLLFRHILPNCMSPIIVQASMDMGYAILATASLSFIGLGARPPDVEWGLMVTSSRVTFLDFWWTATFPGLAIFVSVLAFNLIGDGLRDIFDPKLRT